MASGKNIPEPPKVGEDVSLNLDVIFNSQVEIKGIYVNVQFTAKGTTTPITLYTQDSPASSPGVYEPGDEFTDGVSWLIPSFAPLGHYAVSVTVHGND